jgi:inorganic pyrophosphatase
MPASPYDHLSPLSETGALHVVVETPRHCRSKFKFDEALGVFRLGSVLPSGMVFPYDFGFVPSTLGADGDPLDVLLLMEEPTFVGCLVSARLLGVIEVSQRQGRGRPIRNDRLIAVAQEAPSHERLRSLHDIDAQLLDQIETFFCTFGEQRGKQIQVLHRRGPKAAQRIIDAGIALRAASRADQQ